MFNSKRIEKLEKQLAEATRRIDRLVQSAERAEQLLQLTAAIEEYEKFGGLTKYRVNLWKPVIEECPDVRYVGFGYRFRWPEYTLQDFRLKVLAPQKADWVDKHRCSQAGLNGSLVFSTESAAETFPVTTQWVVSGVQSGKTTRNKKKR